VLVIGTCLVLGLLVGSFLNVVIYRVPLMIDRDLRLECQFLAAADAGKPLTEIPEEAPFNLMVPRSACPKCKRPIRATENIPVVSWLVLGGKCAGCKAPISARYPFVEALTGILSAVVAWKLGFGWPLLAGLVFTWALVALTFIDIDTQLLPDMITLPLVWFGLVAALLAPYLGLVPSRDAALPITLPDAVIGAVAGYMSLWLVYHGYKLLTKQEGMGQGDFKLLAAIGALLGWQMLLPTILFSAIVGAIIGKIMLSLQKKDSATTHISFGPYLAAAGWLSLMFGHEIVSRYLALYTARH
jgi:leader peptidase (prepilin peptidase) / N-methyltransferase